MKIPFYVSMMCAKVQVFGNIIMRGGLSVRGRGMSVRRRDYEDVELTRLCITYVVMILFIMVYVFRV